MLKKKFFFEVSGRKPLPCLLLNSINADVLSTILSLIQGVFYCLLRIQMPVIFPSLTQDVRFINYPTLYSGSIIFTGSLHIILPTCSHFWLTQMAIWCGSSLHLSEIACCSVLTFFLMWLPPLLGFRNFWVRNSDLFMWFPHGLVSATLQTSINKYL